MRISNNYLATTIILLSGLLLVNAQSSSGNTYSLNVLSPRSGIYNGIYMNETRAFLGIPYAQPPIGNLRFKPPQSIYQWGTINATTMPPSCWQSGKPTGYNYSEDCLYLNVYTPKNMHYVNPAVYNCNLPVMVFLHGGRFWTGAATDFLGDHLAAAGNVVNVIIQYRLNIFGFQSFDDNTNLGLQDQQMALRWVQENIRAFGGDPDRVTIYGESAGGSSALYHLTMPSSYNLYNRVVAQSAWQWAIPTAATSRVMTAAYAATKGCANITTSGAPDYAAILRCLSSKSASDITPTVGNSDFFVPIVDGNMIKSQLLTSFKQGRYNKRANIIIGHNYEEGHFMAFSRLGFVTPLDPVSDTTLQNSLTRYLDVYFTPAQRDEVISWYLPVASELGNWLGGSEFFGDYYIICGSILTAEYLSQQGVQFNSYIFNYSSPNFPADEWFLAASHGNELPYIFFQDVYTPYPFAPADAALAHRMSRSWTDYADNGNPSGPFSRWPSYPDAMYYGPDVMNYDDKRPYKKAICENWRQLFEAY
ncbi:crystal protein [Heterostelium album PN500]|uniref:Carboxylic ester hydrolase n=1 Tax=Heterostelium pallidum (strain ATCC 26659 / Pp 5 / PN500) TaxID=670386 RepID=D3AYT3_HETP5|nr:crystal protein [Heterostelium album PN500]EFA85623.1 crystal protein [Heterostelium album PN500]|eukprot:XP_020437730.1 crystal protein [Heterostelium album PN500]